MSEGRSPGVGSVPQHHSTSAAYEKTNQNDSEQEKKAACDLPFLPVTKKTITYHASAAKCRLSRVASVKIHPCKSTGVMVHSLAADNTHTSSEEARRSPGSGH